MRIMLYLFAVGPGLMNAVQSGCNSTPGKNIGQFPAAVVIGLVATASAVAVGLASGRLALPAADKVAGAPWRAWVGGVLGATFVLAQLFVPGPDGIAAAFEGADRLTRAGMRLWRSCQTSRRA